MEEGYRARERVIECEVVQLREAAVGAGEELRNLQARLLTEESARARLVSDHQAILDALHEDLRRAPEAIAEAQLTRDREEETERKARGRLEAETRALRGAVVAETERGEAAAAAWQSRFDAQVLHYCSRA